MHGLRSLIGTVVSAAFAATISPVFTTDAAAAESVEQFYTGKRITVLIGSGAGGGYDTYARLLARHIGRHIPGNPSVISQNMEGAASVVATNYMVNVAPKDGTIIGSLQRGLPLVSLMGQKGPKFKLEELNWLGSLSNEAHVCAIATHTGVKSAEDIFTREFVVGGTGPNTTEFLPALFNNLLRAKFKLIRGYPSTSSVHLAIQRGEVDGVCQSWASFKELGSEMLEKGDIKPLVQVTLRPDRDMQKMGVPMLSDFITADRVAPGQTVEDVTRFFRLTLVAGTMGRPFAVAPGVPAERVTALRAAFMATAEDPKFLAEAKKIRRDIELVTGDEIQEIVADLAKTPKSKLAELEEHFKFKGPTEQAKIETLRHTGKVVETRRGGREIVIDHEGKETAAEISGSRTAVTIDGKEGKRGNVKPGMTCTFVYTGPNSEAEELICKN